MKYVMTTLILCLLFVSCKNDSKDKENNTGDHLELTLENNDKGIEGVKALTDAFKKEKLEASEINFDLADTHYKIARNCGFFEVKRRQIIKNDTIFYILGNLGLQKTINGKEEEMTEAEKSKTTKKIYKTAYFIGFPFGLNSTTVRKRYIGEEEINDKNLAKIKVESIINRGDFKTISTNVLWVDSDEQLAYIASADKDEIELQFRKVVNSHKIEGINFLDYEIYSTRENLSLEDLPKAFMNNKLEKQDETNFSNIKVKIVGRNCD